MLTSIADAVGSVDAVQTEPSLEIDYKSVVQKIRRLGVIKEVADANRMCFEEGAEPEIGPSKWSYYNPIFTGWHVEVVVADAAARMANGAEVVIVAPARYESMLAEPLLKAIVKIGLAKYVSFGSKSAMRLVLKNLREPLSGSTACQDVDFEVKPCREDGNGPMPELVAGISRGKTMFSNNPSPRTVLVDAGDPGLHFWGRRDES